MSESTAVQVRVQSNTAVNVTVRVQPGPRRRPLKFGQANPKLSQAITTFSLPAGWTCPAAKDCVSKSDRKTGHIKDGKRVRFLYADPVPKERVKKKEYRFEKVGGDEREYQTRAVYLTGQPVEGPEGEWHRRGS